MHSFVENYRKRLLEFYDLCISSAIHILYIQYFLTEFTNKITKLLDGAALFAGCDVSGPMLSIKNAMSVAATAFAADSVTRMAMDLMPQEVKETYMETVFGNAISIYKSGISYVSEIVRNTEEYFKL